MAEKLNRDTMLNLLHDLDTRITEPIEMHICGGAAGILMHGIERVSMDIDILASNPELKKINDAISAVAREHRLKDDTWINNEAIRGDHFIPDDYRERLVLIEDNFKFLTVFCLSKIDLAITKLSLYRIRERDTDDLSNLSFNQEEYQILNKIIDRIACVDPQRAQDIEKKLSILNPERGRHRDYANNPTDIQTVDDAIAYGKGKYNLTINSEIITMWKHDYVSGEITIDQVIQMIDLLGKKKAE